MPKEVNNSNNVEVKSSNNVNNENNTKKESIDTLNIDDKILDSLNDPVGNTEDVINLAMVDNYQSTETPIKKDEPNTELFNFDNQDSNK